MHYYNEFDPKAAAWLAELMQQNLIPHGTIDTRSILDVRPSDLSGFTQCHFFAGIGGWPLALQLAGWPVDRPVWTGSCPCQPFSSAGKQAGEADERHLWPEFRRLIAECSPPAVFGEQVASSLGRQWLAGVRADLEALGYAVGSADLCAAGVGAPHIRQRLFWGGRRRLVHTALPEGTRLGSFQEHVHGAAAPDRRLADNPGSRFSERARDGRIQQEAVGARPGEATVGGGGVGGLGYAGSPGFPSRESVTQSGTPESGVPDKSGPSGFWSAYDLIPCRDGKARRVEPGTFPLAHGVPGRVGLLRGYGNAIVPQVAATFVASFEEACASVSAGC